jgi:hypothetical protein
MNSQQRSTSDLSASSIPNRCNSEEDYEDYEGYVTPIVHSDNYRITRVEGIYNLPDDLIRHLYKFLTCDDIGKLELSHTIYFDFDKADREEDEYDTRFYDSFYSDIYKYSNLIEYHEDDYSLFPEDDYTLC